MSKFKEQPDIAVFTTKFVVEEGAPILYVYHFEDGSWQFSGEQQGLKDEDYRVVSLMEILSIDPTLDQLGDLPAGFEAFRKTTKVKWQTVSSN